MQVKSPLLLLILSHTGITKEESREGIKLFPNGVIYNMLLHVMLLQMAHPINIPAG